jgi:pimeloyl-ACP methyl ester carboxylesterase
MKKGNSNRLVRAVVLPGVVMLLVSGIVAADQYTIIGSTTQELNGALTRTMSTVQEGSHPLNRFQMTKVVNSAPGSHHLGALLLLPTISTSFYGFYETSDSGPSLAEFFASRGYDVYGYSPRLQGIPSDFCAANALDCSVMATWDLQMMIDDITFIREQIELDRPGTGVVIGGISFGGFVAIAVVNAHPDQYVGVIPWEGALVSYDPGVRDLNAGYCASIEAMMAAGIYYDSIGGNMAREIVYRADSDPQGPTPISVFPPSLTNHQVLVLALTTPSPAPGGLIVPGHQVMAGSFEEDRFFFASEERFFVNFRCHSGYMNWGPVRDVTCAMAGLDSTHTSNLGNFTGSVLMIGGGRSVGAYMQDQFDAFTAASSKTLLIEPEFGHVDHYMSPEHEKYVERPILDWLKKVVF